jgi:Na+/proline symporter
MIRERHEMGVLDILWHIGNLFLPALALGALAAALAKLAWRRELAAVAWTRLAGPSCAACAAVVLVGLVLWGRDGKMATYAAMVAACALMLWWRGFGPGRR